MKMFVYILILICFSLSVCYTHNNENVHQRIVLEAYNLLKLQLSKEVEGIAYDMGTIYDQQQELNLYNQTINGNHYTYRAEGMPGKITVCPIDIPNGFERDFYIGSEARNVTFRSSNEIIYKPGFTASYGSQVHAYICKDCSRDNQSNNCKQCLDEDFNPKYNKR